MTIKRDERTEILINSCLRSLHDVFLHLLSKNHCVVLESTRCVVGGHTNARGNEDVLGEDTGRVFPQRKIDAFHAHHYLLGFLQFIRCSMKLIRCFKCIDKLTETFLSGIYNMHWSLRT